MPIRWITVRHRDTGHETSIPERAVPGHAPLGWFPLEHFDEQAAAETAEPQPPRDDEAGVRTTKEKK